MVDTYGVQSGCHPFADTFEQMKEMEKQPKQVIVVRKDLKMRKGKIAAQVAHASMKVLLDRMSYSTSKETILSEPKPYVAKRVHRELVCPKDCSLDKWLSGKFTKICVSVDSEDELELIYLRAKNLNIPSALIIDSGATEFNGVPTKTCCAIGPDNPDKIDEITGKLNLL